MVESQQQGEVRERLDAAIAQVLQVLDLGNAACGSQARNIWLFSLCICPPSQPMGNAGHVCGEHEPVPSPVHFQAGQSPSHHQS